MIARRLVVGFLALVGASLGLALDGLGAPAGVAPVVASPAPSASASTGPLPSPPRVEPSVAASPSASPAAGIANFPAVLRALVPLSGASAVPAQTYAAFMRGAEHQDGVLDIVRKDDQLF